MRDFNFKRDFKFVQWKETVKVNVIRAVVAGPVWFVLSLIMGNSLKQALILIIATPIAYLACLMPIGIFCGYLSSKGVSWVGFITLIGAIAIVVADPIVYAIHRSKPELIPVKKYGIFNFVLLIYVIDEERQGLS